MSVNDGIWTPDPPENSGYFWAEFLGEADSKAVIYYDAQLDTVNLLLEGETLPVDEFLADNGSFYSEEIEKP